MPNNYVETGFTPDGMFAFRTMGKADWDEKKELLPHLRILMAQGFTPKIEGIDYQK